MTELSSSFDIDGDWASIRLVDDPFALLYLDRQADNISTEIVNRHYRLLHDFWSKKVGMASSGQEYIVAEYCGANATIGALEEYRSRLTHAYEELSTAAGIERVRSRIREREAWERQREGRTLLGPLMDGLLHDGVFNEDDWARVKAHGESYGIPKPDVAQIARETLLAAGFEPFGRGGSPDDVTISLPWLSPAKRLEREHEAKGSPRPVAAPDHVRRRGGIMAFASVVALVVLAVLAVILIRRTPPTALSSETPRVASSAAPVERVTVPDAQSVRGAQPTGSVAPAASSSPEVQSTKDTAAEKQAAEARHAREEHDAVRSKLTVLQSVVASDPDGASQRAAELRAELLPRSNEFSAEILELARVTSQLEQVLADRRLAAERERLAQEAAADARRRNDEALQANLAQIESLANDGNYSGAKKLADQLLAQPDLPEGVATRAKELRQSAVDALQKLWSGATAKSKTTRSPKN